MTASIAITRQALLPALQAAARPVEARNTIPILANLRLGVEDSRLSVTGTDLDCEIMASVPRPGAPVPAFTLPAKLLTDAVRKLPEGAEVTIVSDGQFADVKGGRSKFRLAVLPASDFPTLDAGTPSHSFTMEAPTLARIIAAVSFAISSEETRYYLNGIHLHQAGEDLAAVATDGHRLSMLTLALPSGADGVAKTIFLHREITIRAYGPPPSPLHVSDHLNGDSLDCRHVNLRWATLSQNARNRFGSYWLQERLEF